MRYLSFSPSDTFEAGRQMGENAQAGQVFALQGDLGAGKTQFSKGLASGLGITESVTSPTFTVLQIYDGGRKRLCHFDLYRLEDPEELSEIGCEEFFGGDNICLVEWADSMPDAIPPDAVWVRIRKDPAKGSDYREILVESEKP